MGLAAVNVMQLAQKFAVLRKILHSDGHWVVQGQSGSPISVLNESRYVTPH